MEKTVLLGAVGHAKIIVDTIERSKMYEIIGFVECPGHRHAARAYVSGWRFLG